MSVNANDPGTSSEFPSMRDLMKLRGATEAPKFPPRILTFVTTAMPGPRNEALTRGLAPIELPSSSLMSSVV